jgi:hypothetical protein
VLGRPDQIACSLWTRDQSAPAALTFDYHIVITRNTLPIGATVAPSPASRATAHYRVHKGLTTPHRRDARRSVAIRPKRAKP